MHHCPCLPKNTCFLFPVTNYTKWVWGQIGQLISTHLNTNPFFLQNNQNVPNLYIFDKVSQIPQKFCFEKIYRNQKLLFPTCTCMHECVCVQERERVICDTGFSDKNLIRKKTFPNIYFQMQSPLHVCFEKQLLSHTVLKHQLYFEDIDCVSMCVNKYMEIFYCQI